MLPALIRKAHEAAQAGAESFSAWGDGSPRREFLHVDDLARAIRFLLEEVDARELAQVTPDTFVNVGTGGDLSVRERAELVCHVVGYTGEIRWDTSKPTGTPRKLMDVSGIKRLGWQPLISLREGIHTTWQWFQEHHTGEHR